MNKKTRDNPYIVVIRCANSGIEQRAAEFLNNSVAKCVVKSKTVTADSAELHYEVRLKSDNTYFVNEISEIQGVRDIVLVSYNGDYTG